MAIVLFDVVETLETEEFSVYARVSLAWKPDKAPEDAALLAVFSTKEGATAFALYQCKTPQNYGRHPDGADGFRPPVAFV